MISEIHIRNFAIIDDLKLRFDSGFNVLTGETGAGKSIILDAMLLLLGNRADTTMIRAGALEATIEATFRLDHTLEALLQPQLEAEGLEGEQADVLQLARELRDSGRSICRVNGRSVNLTLLKDIAEPLVDIHGQGEHLSLLKPRSHLPLLDSYAGIETRRKQLTAAVKELQRVAQTLQELRRDERSNAQRADMLRFQIEEITVARLQPGEEEELRAERTRLANAEQLMRAASEAVTLLTGIDDETLAVADMLGQAERALVQLTRYDETKGPLLEQLQGLVYQVSELSSDLQTYLDRLEFNPRRLDEVEERLETIAMLKRKYGEDIPAILALQAAAEAELERIGNSEERIAALEKELEDHLRHVGKQAKELSVVRQDAAQRLAAAVEKELNDLRMAGTHFQVDFDTLEDPQGLYVGERRLAFDQSGIDKVEFLISTNPGEPLKPLAKVASGGETSRLMLALKTALAQVDATPTLIFDEIDQGIGGRVGDIVGQKLWGLTALAAHQVIVVTHLPQLAGYGDIHFHVSKGLAEGRMITAVHELDRDGRVQELAAMLGTHGDYARDGAGSILDTAQHNKTGLRK